MRLSSTRTARLVALVSAALALMPAYVAHAAPPPSPRRYALPMPATTALPEPYGTYQGQSICTTGATPGVLAFQKMVLSRYRGSRNLGITRGCRSGGRSEHKEGRAWDWGVRLDRPTERAYADDVIGWLLATDAAGVRAANARRLGIMYIIWNRKIWTASRAGDGWRTYFGPNPHVDHVHFSWTWPGANKLTSYWTGTPYGIGAAGGQLDPTFGVGGWLNVQPTESLRLVNSLRWPDGRLWNVSQATATPEVVIEEVLPTGLPGSAFGGSGRTRVVLPPSTSVNDAALTAAGTVVVAGTTVPAVGQVPVPTPDMFAMRITTSGVIDTSFGQAGITTIDLGAEEHGNGLATVGNDVVLAGSSTITGAPTMAVARLTGTGARAAFGTNGVYVAPIGGAVSAHSALARPDGSFVVGCRTADSTCAAKLTPAGAPDPSWGGGGLTTLSVAPGVPILAAGPANTVYATFQQASGYAGIYRLNAAGQGDPTFGTGQYWLQSYGETGCNNRPSAMTVRSDGSPVVAGVLEGCAKGFVARLTIDGPVDPTWGKAGIATVDNVGGRPVNTIAHVSYQTTGHVVIAASGGTEGALAPSLARFTNVGPVPARTVALRSVAATAYAGQAKITAVVRSTNTYALADGVPIVFESRAHGTTRWQRVGAVATTVGGVASTAITPTARAMYRARSGSTDALFGSASSPVEIRVAYALTPSVIGPPAPARLYARQGVTLSLIAAPARPGRRVWLQRLERGKWRTVARPVLDANSVASFRIAASAPTTWQFRWVIFGDAQIDGTTTKNVPVVWYSRPAAKPATPAAPAPAAPAAPAANQPAAPAAG